MNVAQPVAAAAPANPSQPTLPGLEDDVVARVPAKWSDFPDGLVKHRADRPIDAPAFGAFDEAVAAARAIVVADRQDARWGLFKRHAGKVESIALVEASDGIKLLRTNYAVDQYVAPVPGQMVPGQNRTIGVPTAIVRERPSTLALVGADNIFDLRSGAVAGPTPFSKA